MDKRRPLEYRCKRIPRKWWRAMENHGGQRLLAAILAADVVGYSKLMGADEAGTLATLRVCLDDIVRPALAAHGGRLVKLMGDGVNVAARLEALAEPGGICVSRTVADQVGSRAGVSFQPMGAQTLKNIAQVVEVFRVAPEGAQAPKPHRNRTPARYALMLAAALLAAGAWWMTRPDFTPADPAKMAAPLPDGPSIAVLPFDYLGPNREENGYIADALSENIISALARLPETLAIARNSTFTYKDKAVDVREVSETFLETHH